MIRPSLLHAATFALSALPAVAAASGATTPAPAAPWQWEWNARLRQEHVADDAFARTADATTLRLRAGLHLRLARGFEALLEAEGIASADDRYNSGANGHGDRPAITDPAGVQANQAWLGWKRDGTGLRIGRQRLGFDNQRWIGNSGWRQNEQTFDALAFDWQASPAWTARYAWLDRVHRVAGDDALDPLARERRLDSHLGELAWKRGVQQVAAYAWLHADRDVATASTATFGVRAVTDAVHGGRGWGLALELARQHEYAANPLAFSHRYWLLEPAYTWRGTTVRAGWEHLGGDGRHALQTPLATLHAFNGWADKFLVTPAGGLDDRYVGAGGKLHGGRCDWTLAWHDYRAGGGGRYGREWDAALGFPVAGAAKGLVKLADYRSDGFARDTRKLWLQLEWTR